MKRLTAQWVSKAEEDIEGARLLAVQPTPKRDSACFHCQQSAEKYLKALLQERGLPVPKIHILSALVQMLLPFEGTLRPLQRSLKHLTRYAVEYRYPGARARTREMLSALRTAERTRAVVRACLGLSA